MLSRCGLFLLLLLFGTVPTSVRAWAQTDPLVNDFVNNGADVNASRSAGVLEVAEAIAKNPARRSVIFVLFTAE